MSSMNSEFLHYDKDNVQSSNLNSCWNTGNVNGKMKLVELRGKQFNGLRRQSIEVTVYHSQAEHFVAIHSKTKSNPPIGVLKLKNTTVESVNGNSLQVQVIGCDKPATLTFLLDAPEDLDYWIKAFTSRINSYQNDLANITEDQEDEYY